MWILKHDVHGLPLESLLDLARCEREIGIAGSYFFMAPDHPLTRPFYEFSEQARGMRAIEAMGHEIGIHVDPFFLMHLSGLSTEVVMSLIIKRFADEGLTAKLGNLHGNSKFKMPDRNGYSTAFDLFEEIGRQPDYPQLANVPPETAALIRANRSSLVGLGLNHWSDGLAIWSRRHGHIVTNYITDNWLEKDGSLLFGIHGGALGRYLFIRSSPDDYRRPDELQHVAASCTNGEIRLFPLGSTRRPLDDRDCDCWFSELAAHPTQILLHPQHY